MRNNSYRYDGVHADVGLAAAMEARRLSEKYNKDFLDCDDLVTILDIGKNNARELMRSKDFPTLTIGNRKVVAVLSFAMWMVKQEK